MLKSRRFEVRCLAFHATGIDRLSNWMTTGTTAMTGAGICTRSGTRAGAGSLCALFFFFVARFAAADDQAAAARFHERVKPILETYCSACHGYGERKGGHAFDEFKSDAAMVHDTGLWLEVLKNVRAGLMPP